jgi:hypothetical protein
LAYLKKAAPVHIKLRYPLIVFGVLFLFCLPAVKARAQFNKCVDSTVISPGYYCSDTTWRPVCGCDNHTYRNDCEAYFHHGIINRTDRTCEEITIVHLYPIPVINYINYRLYLRQNGGDAFVYIYDMFGKTYYFHYFHGIADDTETLDLSHLPYGVYVMVAVSNGQFALKQFIKATN